MINGRFQIHRHLCVCVCVFLTLLFLLKSSSLFTQLSCTTFTMFKHVILLLLFCIFNYSGTAPVGNNLTPVRGIDGLKGDDVVLPCGVEDREISHIALIRLSKNILVCENEECESENGRVIKEGSCDVVMKDLRLSDAGKYSLRVYFMNDQERQEPEVLEFQLTVQDEVSVKAGDELKLDVLLINADKVLLKPRRSTGPKEVWTRERGVMSDRMTIRDGDLIIKAFTATDVGTYEVLDSDEEILIMITVTESRTERSAGNLMNLKAQTNDTQQNNYWILWLVVSMALFLVAVQRRRMPRCLCTFSTNLYETV